MTGMRMAMKAAELGQHKIYKMGAAVVRGGSVIAVGFNRREKHAEESALGKLVNDGKSSRFRTKNDACNADVYVARIKKDNKKQGSSRPCENCWKHLREAGIRKVFYFNEKGEVVCEKV